MADTGRNKFSLSAQLLQVFHLSKDPFSDENIPFYTGAQRQYVLDTLKHLVNFGDLVLVLTGGNGSGKTVLLNELISAESDKLHIIDLPSASLATVRSLVEYFSQSLALPVVAGEPIQQTLQRFQDRTAADYQKGKRTLVILDQSEMLPHDIFQLLIKTFKNRGVDSGAVLLLSGTPDILRRVLHQGVQPEQCDWMHQLQLKPLTEQEMNEYLQWRFQHAGVDNLQLSERQIELLAELGKGNPGRINRVAPAILLGADKSLNRKTTPTFKFKAINMKITLTLLGLILFSVLLVGYQYGYFSRSEKNSKTDKSSLTSSAISTTKEAKASPDIDKKIDETLRYQALQKKRSKTLSVGAITPKISVVMVEQKTVKTELMVKPLSDAVSRSGVSKKATQGQFHKKEALPFYQRSSDWLLSQPSSYYAIQLSSNASQQTAIDYIRTSGFSKKLFYIKTYHKKRSRFVVLFGIYPSHLAAKKEVSKLPAKFKKQKPWVRSVSGLQKQLSKHQ